MNEIVPDAHGRFRGYCRSTGMRICTTEMNINVSIGQEEKQNVTFQVHVRCRISHKELMGTL